MRSVLLTLVSVLLFAMGFAVASPYIALNGLREALESGDAEAISKRVDFPLLRKNLSDQLADLITAEDGNALEDNPIARLARGVAKSMFDSTLDALVTPAGLSRLVAGERPMSDPGASGPAEQNTRRNLLSEARVQLETLDRVTVWVPNDYGNEIRIVMRRYGITWKLTNVIIPGVDS